MGGLSGTASQWHYTFCSFEIPIMFSDYIFKVSFHNFFYCLADFVQTYIDLLPSFKAICWYKLGFPFIIIPIPSTPFSIHLYLCLWRSHTMILLIGQILGDMKGIPPLAWHETLGIEIAILLQFAPSAPNWKPRLC